MNSRNISHLIDYNTAKFFLSLGHLNKDEVLDTPEIKYIFTKNWQSLIFTANFNELSVSANLMQLMKRIKELNIPVLWFVTPMSRQKTCRIF